MAFTEQTLELDSTHISNLFGQFDCYLKKLERAFGTQIIDRCFYDMLKKQTAIHTKNFWGNACRA